MDEIRFDAVAARLGAAIGRREGLKGALAGIAAALAGANAADVAGAGRRRKRGTGHDGGAAAGKPEIEGPCGTGPKRNACQKDKDCCTGFCNRKINKCRCLRAGQACQQDRNCCQGRSQKLSCIDNVCRKSGNAGIPTGAPCQPGQACKDPAASCTTYTNQLPAGTYCLLPLGSTACGETDGHCVSQFCNGGACQPCTVCSSSANCPFTSIGSAVTDASAGTVIGIAAGTYDTYMAIETDNLTLRRCGGSDAGSVVWENTAANDHTLYLEETGISTLTVRGIDFKGANQYTVMYAAGTSSQRLALNVANCTFTGQYSVDTDYNYPAIVALSFVDPTITDTTFTGFHADSYGGGAMSCEGDAADATNTAIFTNVSVTGCYSGYSGGAFDIRRSIATLTNCTITGNTASNSGGGINMDGAGTVTLVDCTISGNTTEGSGAGEGIGGGIRVRDNNSGDAYASTLVIQGSTTITGNTASGPNASNGGGVISDSGGVITGGSSANISGNIPSGQDCSKQDGGTYSTVNCSTWA
ncbi:MAG: hypothetical protein ACKOWF_17535 [Chloroflexota bacterium]